MHMLHKKRKKKKKFSINTGNFIFTLAFFLILAGGIVLISRQFAEAYRSKSTYEHQQEALKAGEEQEKELLQDRKDIDNPEMFEAIARKNGYRFENETAVNVMRPITEEDKWK